MSIRLAVVSDIHLGDPMSVMAFQEQPHGQIKLGSKYEAFRTAIQEQFEGEPLDYLVLLGDILDFSIKHYSEAYAISEIFFNQLIKDNLLKEYVVDGKKQFGTVIYIAGNHDFDMWHTVEYQSNIVNRIRHSEPARKLHMSLPAIIDDRACTPIPGFTLPHVRGHSGNVPKYGGLFLDTITKPAISFSFGYPNLYLITESETVMMTHGQYLDSAWSFLGKWGLEVLKGDLLIKNSEMLDLAETVGINVPTSELLCSSVGQAGPLTQVILNLEHEIKAKKTKTLKKYLRRIKKKLKKNLGWFKKLVYDAVFLYGEKQICQALCNMQAAQYNDAYLHDDTVKMRLQDYYRSTNYEIEELQKAHGVAIPQPSRLIFGHTHQPISWDNPLVTDIKLPGGGNLCASNTGGWLNRITDNTLDFCGAEIHFYETGKGFSSVRIT